MITSGAQPPQVSVREPGRTDAGTAHPMNSADDSKRLVDDFIQAVDDGDATLPQAVGDSTRDDAEVTPVSVHISRNEMCYEAVGAPRVSETTSTGYPGRITHNVMRFQDAFSTPR